jgi:hypothetical protein
MARHPVMIDPRLGGYDTLPLATRPAGRRLRLLGLIGACLLVAGWLAGLTATRRGWLTIGLAGLVLTLLALHHRDGGGRWLVRVLCEYAAVGLLAGLLVIAFTPPAPRPPAQHRPATANASGQLCPKPVQAAAGGACDFITRLWHQTHGAGQPQAPTTTTPRGRHG